MKRLVLFFAAVLFTAISANLFAQNSGTTPTPGSTWEYSVFDNSNDYAWSVTVGNLTTDAGTDAVITQVSNAPTITIEWASTVTVGVWYYVHVVEDDGTCTNHKVLPVQITASQFYLSIAANKTDTCYNNAVVVTLDGNTPKYNHGTATALYTVTPTGMGTATGYSFNITELFTPSSAGLSSVPSVTSGSGSVDPNTGVVTVTDANAVTLTFVITNTTLYDNTSDAAGIAADFNQKITHSGGINSHNITDNLTGSADANTNVARPHTTTIGSN